MLNIHEITVTYPDKTKAIDSVTFSLGKSENIALIGENGAGKTTLLLTIVGIIEPLNGTISVCDTALNKKNVKEIRKKIGLVFQNPDDQLFMPRIYDDVAFGCRNYGLTESEVIVEATLALLGISHLRCRSSLNLSGGEKRMAAIATVLAMEPSILMFDEPTAFLDPKAKRMLAGVLRELNHPKIIATHDMAFAAEVCNRVIILKDGRIAADGGMSILEDKAFLQKCGL